MRKLVNEVEATRKVPAERINFVKGVSHTGNASRTDSVSHTGRIFGKVYTPKSDTSELSEGNGEIRKKVERRFGEKMLGEGYG